MKKWTKAALGILLSFMCLFTCIGYAQFSSTLIVSGRAELAPPNAIFITGISNVQTSGVTINATPVNIGYPSTKVMSEIVFEKKNSSVTFDVQIMNGTAIDQYFDVLKKYTSMEGVEGSFSHSKVDASTSVSQGTKLAAGEKMTFTVTLTYSGTGTKQQRKMLHEFIFAMSSDDLTQAVSKGVTDKFADILNNRLEEDIKYNYNGSNVTIDNANTYQSIVNNMEDDNSGNYIGNLMGSDADDKALLTALFEGELTFNVGNQEVPITVMVKEKNVYGNSSTNKEMVLYITADDLQTTEIVPVFVAVFSKDNSNEWVQIGEIFEGQATVNSYSGWPWGWGGRGSFNTESWESTKDYYGVATESGIDAVMKGYVAQN